MGASQVLGSPPLAPANGHKLSDRGPVPGSVRSAYRKPMRQARLIRRNLSYNNCIAK